MHAMISRESPPQSQRSWLRGTLLALLILSVIVINQKSLNDSRLFASERKEKEHQQQLRTLEEALNAKLKSIEIHHNEEEDALVSKIVSLEERLDLELKSALQAQREISQSSSSSSLPPNDCLHHINHVRGIVIYSQNNEDGALLQTLHCMGGHGTREYFEFGSENGNEVNTRVLRELYGWHGHLLDGSSENSQINLHKEYFTPSNIVELMDKYGASRELDVLSVDCDIDDFYVTREILRGGYRPRIIINEFNINFGYEWAVAVKPKPVGRESSPESMWTGDCYYGASAKAFLSLLRGFGYAPVFANTVNLIFVRVDVALQLGLSLPSPDIFPGLLPRALHRDCSMKTWKTVDEHVIENAVNVSMSHVEFADGMDEIVLRCMTYHSKKRIVSSFHMSH